MLEIILHDRGEWRERFLPLVFTRPVGELRVGVLTFREKWKRIFNTGVSFYTTELLQERFPKPNPKSDHLVISANICPNNDLIKALESLPFGAVLERQGRWIAYRPCSPSDDPYSDTSVVVEYSGCYLSIEKIEDVFLQNSAQINFDYQLITDIDTSCNLNSSNIIIGVSPFVGQNVDSNGSTFNTVDGPIYIGDNVIIEPGCHFKGPVSIGEGSRIKTGAKIYPNVTVGPGSTVSGEINNTVIWGNSAKGHEGYLGCSVIGEGCNIGAGTNNSNLQNNWGEVSVYDYSLKGYRNTGLSKVGFFMGDYAMCGINSLITTGAVIGVGSQIAKSKFIPKFVADFTWNTDLKQEEYDIEKFESMLINRAKVRKEVVDGCDVRILREVYRLTKRIRKEFLTKKY